MVGETRVLMTQHNVSTPSTLLLLWVIFFLTEKLTMPLNSPLFIHSGRKQTQIRKAHERFNSKADFCSGMDAALITNSSGCSSHGFHSQHSRSEPCGQSPPGRTVYTPGAEMRRFQPMQSRPVGVLWENGCSSSGSRSKATGEVMDGLIPACNGTGETKSTNIQCRCPIGQNTAFIPEHLFPPLIPA